MITLILPERRESFTSRSAEVMIKMYFEDGKKPPHFSKAIILDQYLVDLFDYWEIDNKGFIV